MSNSSNKVVVLIYLLQNRPIGQIKPHEFEETSADIFKTRKGFCRIQGTGSIDKRRV